MHPIPAFLLPNPCTPAGLYVYMVHPAIVRGPQPLTPVQCLPFNNKVAAVTSAAGSVSLQSTPNISLGDQLSLLDNIIGPSV